MKTKLPTTPGPYWWREKDGDEWELWHVDNDVNQPGLRCRRGFNVSTPEKLGGQWAKCPRPDEGQEAWAVFNPDKEIIVFTVSDTPQRAINRHAVSSEDTWSKREAIGYTCEPVTIYRRNKK